MAAKLYTSARRSQFKSLLHSTKHLRTQHMIQITKHFGKTYVRNVLSLN